MKKLLMILSLILVATLFSCEKENDPDATLQAKVTFITNGFKVEVTGGISPYIVQVYSSGKYTDKTWLYNLSVPSLINDEGIITHVLNITDFNPDTIYWLRLWDSNGTYKSLGGFNTRH